MSHLHSSLLDRPPLSHPQFSTSLLLPSRGDHQPPDPRTAGLLDRLAIQSPFTDERRSIGRPASREKQAIPAKYFHSESSSHIPSIGRPIAAHSHERKSSRDTKSVQEKHLTSERIRSAQQEVRNFLKFRADEAVEGEQEALSRPSEAEFRTGFLLEEHRNQILSEANSERLMQESRRKVQTMPSAT